MNRQHQVAAVLLAGLIALLGWACRSDERVDERRARESVRPESSQVSGSASQGDFPAKGADWRALYDGWNYPQPIPDFQLVDHTGQAFQLGAFADGYVLIGFIYTRCPLPAACPLTTEKMRAVQARWRELSAGGQTGGKALQLLSLTLDPGHDTPERLAEFARERGLDTGNWRLATGPHELLQSALPSLFSVLALPRGAGDIQHTVKVGLLGPGLRIAREWADNEFSVDDVVAEILR